MIAQATRTLDIYLAFGSVAVKRMLQFRIWFWVGLVGQIVFLVAWYSFWQAAYAHHQTIGGLHEAETERYILLARLLNPVVGFSLTGMMATYIRQGMIAAELLRPIDFQARFYAESLARNIAMLIQNTLPAGIVAVIFLGLRIPAGIDAWAAFALTLFLGTGVMFFFDYLVATLAFYTTEAWGLMVLQIGIFTFASGSLLPLNMLPGWLRLLTDLLPFSQAVYVPVSLLSGITPTSDVWRLCLIELAWLIGLAVASRLIFRVAVRAITVQGG